MIILVENLKQGVTRDGKVFYSFWVRFLIGKEWMSVSGWRYFVEDHTLSTPSVYKGAGKNYANTMKVSGAIYNAVKERIEETLKLFGFTEKDAA
jgi:hypothetical protein